MKNKEIGELLYRIGDILELKGEIVFKVRAYRNAAVAVEALGENIEDVYGRGELEKIKGVGKAIGKKIGEYIETGSMAYLEEVRKEVHPDMLKMLDIHTLGPRKIMFIHRALGIETIKDLKKVAEEGRIEVLDGFGKVSQDNILSGIRIFESYRGRMLLGEAHPKAESIMEYLKERCAREISDISVTGSLRRMCETIGDIDILVAPSFANLRGREPAEIISVVMEAFTGYPGVEAVLARGDTKSSIRLEDGVQVDLRVIEKSSWGAALQYFTGSKDHNVHLRKIAIERGLKINEYGLYDRDTGERIAGDDEVKVYEKLGLQYVPPEVRENRGEIELALRGELPELVDMNDIKGDLHMHTVRSDGSMTVRELVEEARGRGYRYIGITDHSPNVRIAGGPAASEIPGMVREVREIEEDYNDIVLLAGAEVDIMRDGSLDYPRETLRELDLVIAAVHSSFSLPEEEMTERIVKALSSGYVNILAHPTCRKIGKREAIDVDMKQIIDAAAANDVALEINAMPIRLDLNMDHVAYAVEGGARLVIDTDSHKPHHLDVMKYGVATARKGRATAESVINTWDTERLLRFLDK